MNAVVVVGSANVDYVTRVERRPAGGETVMGSDLELTPGGKGANQAVAARLLGADVAFLGCVGDDEAGRNIRKSLDHAGVDTSSLLFLPGTTGAALITVTHDGENAIVVSPGANAHATTDRLNLRPHLANADIVVMQLEIPLSTVRAVADACATSGVRFLLNAAPATRLGRDLLSTCDPLVVNESEARLILAAEGIKSPEELIRALSELGPKSIVITLGGAGSIGLDRDGSLHREPALRVPVVDTTGAGDAFVGALAAALAARKPLSLALHLATRVAGFAVQHPGAQASYATTEELATALLG